MRFLAVSIVSIFFLTSSVMAEEKKIMGSFVKKAGEFDVTVEFKKNDVVVLKMSNGDIGFTMDNKATFEKDSVVKCKVTKFEKMGDFPVTKDKGYEFKFRAKMDGKNLVVSDLEGEDINDEAKSIIGGTYEPVSKEK